MNLVPEISIDKLVIVGYDTGGFHQRIEEFSKLNFSETTTDYIDKTVRPPYPYDYAWHCRDGTFIQYTRNRDYRDIRLEFNPNKCEKENVIHVLNCIKYGVVNRVDLAFDFFGADISKYFILDHQARKYHEYRTAIGDLETRYFGSDSSDLQVVLYNKALEQGIEGDWWRVEARLSGEWSKTLTGDKKRSDGFYRPFMGNPFVGIQISYPDEQQYANLKIQDRAMIEYLLGRPEELSRLSPNTRAKYKKILASLGTNKDLDLERQFEKNYSDIMHKVFVWLRESNKNNVI